MNYLELEDLLHKEIPISKQMNVHVLNASESEVCLQLSLSENRNHKGTAFGGSQYAAAALACYGLFLIEVRSQGFSPNNIVIGEGSIKYKKPVKQDFKVIAKWDSNSRDIFFSALKKNKKARVLLTAEVIYENMVCSYFSGEFVAQIETIV